MSQAPVVYVETNFLIAAAFPDHEHHAAAQRLLTEGPWRLCVPYPAAFEIRGSAQDTSNEVRNLTVRAGAAMDSLRAAGVLSISAPELHRLRTELTEYARRDFAESALQVLQHPRVSLLHPDEHTFRVVEDVFASVSFGGRDLVDAYILACVLRYAASLPASVPRVFMSTNSKQFSPDRPNARVPQRLYDGCRLVHIAHFSLQAGLRDWRRRFGADLI